MRLGITSASGWTLRMASFAALNSCPPPSQFCGGEVRVVRQRRTVPSASSSSSGPPGTRALERDTATGATRAGVRIKDREMNAREDARRDAREDAPGARHLSYLARPGARGTGTHVAVRHDVSVGRRVRGLRARDEPARAGGARRGSRAAAGERRPHGGERQVRERRRSHRERSAARERGPARPQPRNL